MRKTLISLSVLVFLTPLSAFAYGKLLIGSTMTMKSNSTVGMYIDHQVWLPGTWSVAQGTGSVVFSRPAPDGKHQSFVKLTTIPKEKCGFGSIRMAALKAWGGSNLDQSQARIQALSFGTSKYKGYTWVLPSVWNGDQHWCMGQDMLDAVDVSAPVGDPGTITFVRNDLMLQLVVRNGRSVPIPR